MAKRKRKPPPDSEWAAMVRAAEDAARCARATDRKLDAFSRVLAALLEDRGKAKRKPGFRQQGDSD